MNLDNSGIPKLKDFSNVFIPKKERNATNDLFVERPKKTPIKLEACRAALEILLGYDTTEPRSHLGHVGLSWQRRRDCN